MRPGNYSRLACEFYFVRSLGYYVIHIYVPSSLIVVLSWVSFWLHRDAAPARVALGITTVLTMTTLISSTNASLPKISYLKSIDVYLVTCFVMVFAAILEYAAVSYIGNLKPRCGVGGGGDGGCPRTLRRHCGEDGGGEEVLTSDKGRAGGGWYGSIHESAKVVGRRRRHPPDDYPCHSELEIRVSLTQLCIDF